MSSTQGWVSLSACRAIFWSIRVQRIQSARRQTRGNVARENQAFPAVSEKQEHLEIDQADLSLLRQRRPCSELHQNGGTADAGNVSVNDTARHGQVRNNARNKITAVNQGGATLAWVRPPCFSNHLSCTSKPARLRAFFLGQRFKSFLLHTLQSLRFEIFGESFEKIRIYAGLWR